LNPSISPVPSGVAETLFISDLHLDPERPALIRLVERFLAGRAANAEALYILGDLFEYWIGDDTPSAGLEIVIHALHELSAGGVPVYFMAGNRDFLVGETFAAQTGCKLLRDPTLIELYGVPTLLMHGDTLCTDDHAYQALRHQLRHPQWQSEFLSLPVEKRQAQALALREQSRQATQSKREEIMDANPQAVASAMREHGALRLIHGHTHRPAIHRFSLDDRDVQRIVLGDWYVHGSVLSATPSGLTLETL